MAPAVFVLASRQGYCVANPDPATKAQFPFVPNNEVPGAGNGPFIINGGVPPTPIPPIDVAWARGGTQAGGVNNAARW